MKIIFILTILLFNIDLYIFRNHRKYYNILDELYIIDKNIELIVYDYNINNYKYNSSIDKIDYECYINNIYKNIHNSKITKYIKQKKYKILFIEIFNEFIVHIISHFIDIKCIISIINNKIIEIDKKIIFYQNMFYLQ